MTAAAEVRPAAAGASAGALGRDAAVIGAVALAARLGVVAWAASRFPPAADGAYYHRIAERIAAGHGYTWLWPDGAVTYAAHYPVGYPGAVAALYAIFGPRPALAMALNAVIGALAAPAVHALAARALGARRAAVPTSRQRRGAAIAGLLVALHPGLVAYTPALMTEGVTAALIACAAFVASAARDEPRGRGRALGLLAGLGALLGAAALVRPQAIALAPLFGALAWAGPARGLPADALRRIRRSWAAAIAVTAVALAVCAPWTLRNCSRMGRCAFVSVNGGWNLLIGADPASTGAWSPVKVPDACREVWDEAAKDECFGREARGYIAEHPAAWLALAPRKLAATFDYCGAAGWYLHEASPAAFGEALKVGLGGLETIYERGVLLLALLWAARGEARGRSIGRSARLMVLAAGVLFLFMVHAWVAYAVLLAAGLWRARAVVRGPILPAAALGVLALTALTHAVFFGAGRYGMVTFPLLSGLAALGISGDRSTDFDSGAPHSAS